mmetsp:Transcript_131711/g.232904  ORF Transcript_131711/g.232904 Transcript_131711/m.232904 type:complete len:257 (-) Transcript_131711:79-849(-)
MLKNRLHPKAMMSETTALLASPDADKEFAWDVGLIGERKNALLDLTYCEGAPKPTLRGVLHLVALVLTPLWAYLVVKSCSPVASFSCMLAVAFTVASPPFCWAISVAYHHGNWSTPEAERLLQKLDHMGVALSIAGMITPLILLALPSTGRYLLVALWCFAAVVCILVLRGLSSVPLFGGLVLFAMPALYWIHSTEIVLFACSALSSMIGALAYTHNWLELWPGVWSSHESFHFFTIVGTGFATFVNYSVIQRSCG